MQKLRSQQSQFLEASLQEGLRYLKHARSPTSRNINLRGESAGFSAIHSKGEMQARIEGRCLSLQSNFGQGEFRIKKSDPAEIGERQLGHRANLTLDHSISKNGMRCRVPIPGVRARTHPP